MKYGSNKSSSAFYAKMGVTDIDKVKTIKNKIFSSLIPKIGLVDGVLNFLKSLDGKVALVTGSPLDYARAVLKQNKVIDYFDVLISGQDLAHNKPHPEPYLHAVSKLSVDKNDCVVFEDSENGIASAKAAGFFCYALTSKFGKYQDLSRADKIIDCFKDVN